MSRNERAAARASAAGSRIDALCRHAARTQCSHSTAYDQRRAHAGRWFMLAATRKRTAPRGTQREGVPRIIVARAFGVSYPTIQRIDRNETRVAEPSALEHANHLLQRKRDKAIQTRPKAQRDAAIYARRTAGASYKQLAAEFNLTVKQVGSILNVHRKRLASDPPWIKAERDDTINKGVK